MRHQLERSRFFAQSPQLVYMDKLIKKKKGMEIDEKIYDPELINEIEEGLLQDRSEVNYKINIKNVLESEKSKYI